MQHIIIGDGVAGHTAAEQIREHDSDAEIHVFTTENVPFYDRIGLRDYVRNGRDLDALILNEEEWYNERDIQLHRDTEIVAVDRDAQKVETSEGEPFAYDRLLLAVGGHPRTLPFEEGVDRAHHLWTLEDHGKPLRSHLEEAEKGVVIGGGLLGFDLIGSFTKTDTDTTFLIREDRWWHSVLPKEGAAIMHNAMRDYGVDLKLEEETRGMEQDGDTVTVTTDKGSYEAGVVGIAVGHLRNLDLAEDAGLETNHGIVCDAHMQTSDPAIYTAGDVAEYHDVVLEKQHMGGSWVTAQNQGETAGKNMAGEEEPLRYVDTYTVNHFGLNVASLGDPRDVDNKQVLTVVDEDNNRFRKVVVDGNRVVGAAILGEMRWLSPLRSLILNKTNISDHMDALEDADTDLRQLQRDLQN